MGASADRFPTWPLGRRLHAAGPARTRVLLTTEGTYPYTTGGVTSWCDLLVRGLPDLDWHVLPIVAANRGRAVDLPENARLSRPIELGNVSVNGSRPTRH